MTIHKLCTNTCIGLVLSCAVASAYAQSVTPEETAQYRAKVMTISEPIETIWNGVSRITQDVGLRLLSGPDVGTSVTVEYARPEDSDTLYLSTGDTIVVDKLTKIHGGTEYMLREQYRLNGILLLLGAFFGLSILLGGWKGLNSFIGLGVSILLLTGFIVPRIAAGDNPLLVSVVGSGVIACSSLYLAHGFSRRTTIALLSTMITLGLTTLLALFAVHITSLFGMGSEEAMFLQFGTSTINLRGLLLGGIVIGTLGVLDDITTAQTAAVAEISRANTRLSEAELFVRGSVVGREHIASLINTLALAYFGTSLPLMLLFSLNRDVPVWVILNSEYIAEEIIRTLVGSTALLFAVPISTAIAARTFAHGKHSDAAHTGHSHIH